MRIVYLCTSPKPGTHAGGVKVIYDHCLALREMGIDAVVLHDLRGYAYPWAERPAPTVGIRDVQPTDHFVLPEIKAAACARRLIEAGMRYSVFVQNGYYLGECGRRHSDADTHFAYANATAILSISSDTTDLITLHYPDLAPRLIEMRCAVNPAAFSAGPGKKGNVITYMPRKLGRHATAVARVLERRLPSGWRLRAIERMSESDVANALRESRIFMSFSELEGLGLPPIEAAMCGNYVIGYHGGGGRDYWRGPNFEAIETGDLCAFATRVLARAKQLDATAQDTLDALQPGIDALRARYSPQSERESLQRFIDTLRAAEHRSAACSAVRLDMLGKLQRRPRLRALLRSGAKRLYVRVTRGGREVSSTLLARIGRVAAARMPEKLP